MAREGPSSSGRGNRGRPPPERPARVGTSGRRPPERLAGDRGDVLYGRHPVREALRGRRRVREVWATEAVACEAWLAEARITSTEGLAALCGSPEHQGVCARVDAYPYADPADLLAGPDPLVVALDEIQDPQNLGAICRTAECAGADGLVVPRRRSAAVTPAVAKASAGAVEHLRVARVRNLADFLGDAKAAGCWCYGAATEGATPYDQPDYGGGVVLVLGSEGRGLRPRVAKACDALISLPVRGRVASLNAGAAAAALLYEILHSRSQVDSGS